MSRIEPKRIMRAIIDRASFIVDNSLTFFLDGNGWKNAIESISIIPYDDRNLSYGLEIRFKQTFENTNIQIPFDSTKIPAGQTFGSVINGFELTANSLVYNRLLGINKIKGFGIDVFDENDSILEIIQTVDENDLELDTDGGALGSLLSNNTFFKAGHMVKTPINFGVRGVRIYFFDKQGVDLIFQKPEFIIRLLGSVVPKYFELIKLIYQIELSQFQRDDSVRTSEYVLPKLFNLFDFIFYYDNAETIELDPPDDLLERKLFIQRVLKDDYDKLSEVEGLRDMKIDYEILKRIDTIFFSGRINAHNHFKTDTEYLVDSFESLVERSPEKCFITELVDIKDTYLTIFDSDYYNFDIIDLLSDENTKFSSLTDNSKNNNCKALINGAYWDLSREKESRAEGVFKENLYGLLNSIGTIKSIPKGNTVFKSGAKWQPGKYVPYHHDQLIRVNQGDTFHYFFYQTASNKIKFGKGVLPTTDSQNPSDKIEVGCDFLVGLVNEDTYNNVKIILDADTDDWVYPENEADFNANFTIQSSNPNYQYPTGDVLNVAHKGFPLFGTIKKSNKMYLFMLVSKDSNPYTPSALVDDIYNNRARLSINFLKGLGANNIFFTDGGTSTAFIYDNTSIIKNSRTIKDPLIASAIGIKPINNFESRLVLESKLNLGGSKEVLLSQISISNITQLEKEELENETLERLSMPFIDHPTFPRNIATAKGHFGSRVINGVQGFHEGIDMKAQSPLNVKVNIRGKVFRKAFGGGFGNYVILCHGRDIFRNYYFTLYAHLSSTSVNVNDIIEKDSVVGITGETQAPGQPHLHFELIISKKNYSEIEYDDLLHRDLHLDPEDFILPNNLIID